MRDRISVLDSTMIITSTLAITSTLQQVTHTPTSTFSHTIAYYFVSDCTIHHTTPCNRVSLCTTLFHSITYQPHHTIPCHTASFYAIPHEPITHYSLAIERFHRLNPPSNLLIFLCIPFTTLYFSTSILFPHNHTHPYLHPCTYPWTYVLSVAAKFDNNWGRKFHERVLLLVRDIANPSGEDPYFPAWRHKDW